MRHVLFVTLLCLPWALTAQFIDDFADPDLSTRWSGDLSHFFVNSDGMLQLNAPSAGVSVLCTELSFDEIVEWRLLFRMTFPPSDANKLRIHLMSDSAIPVAGNGYFIDVGENGPDDAMRLFRSDGGVATQLGFSEGIYGGDPSEARVRVIRDPSGQWSIYADTGGDEDWALMFTASDNTYAPASGMRFCFQCIYTETRRDRFFFDDIYIGPVVRDTLPPAPVSVDIISDLLLALHFNERMDSAGTLASTSYTISPGIGNPETVMFDGDQQRTVLLALSQPLVNDTEYIVHINGVRDTAGNVASTEIGFIYFIPDDPLPYDILINEIMADPNPPLGQPNAEYIELYNRSARSFSLENYVITVGTQARLLPQYIMRPGDYVIIVHTNDAALWSHIDEKVQISLPALTNSGTTIELADDLGNTLHRMSYTLATYKDAAKNGGGWSLELINPEAPCRMDENWRASNDLTGGTPARANSVLNAGDDPEGPILLSAFPVSAQSVVLTFDKLLAENGVTVTINPSIGINVVSTERHQAILQLAESMQLSVPYTLTVISVADCQGVVAENQSVVIALPEEPQPGDILINELLFDPGVGGVRYLELINVSPRYLGLVSLIVADIRGDTVNAIPVTAQFLLEPGGIAVLTPDPQDIISRYFTHDASRIVMQNLPAFDRRAGNVTVYSRQGVIMDVFDYDVSMHNPLLRDRRAVALERLSVSLSTAAASTWQSAAQTAGFGTPGLPNSQHLPDLSGSGIIELENATFSPDQDGFEDFLVIHFPGVEPGTVGNIRVFDAHGREVIHLMDNTSLAPGSVVLWDGATADGSRARIGPYILWIELFHADGTVQRFKRMCVLAERL